MNVHSEEKLLILLMMRCICESGDVYLRKRFLLKTYRISGCSVFNDRRGYFWWHASAIRNRKRKSAWLIDLCVIADTAFRLSGTTLIEHFYRLFICQQESIQNNYCRR